MRLNGKDSESVYVVLGMPQGSILGLLLFILNTSELFYILGNQIVGYADDTMICAVIPRPHSCPQVMESLESGIGSNRLLVFEVAHEAQP